MSKSSSIGSNRNYQDRNQSKSNNSSPATETKSSLVQVYEHEHYSKIANSWQGGRGPDSVDDFEKEPSSPVQMQRWTSSPTNHGSNVKILPPPSELSAPKGYKYISEWKIDVGKDEKDELGWEYYVSKGVGRRRRRWLRTVEIVVIKKKQEEKEVKKEDDYDLNVKTEKIKIASGTFSPPKSSLVGMRPYFIARLLKELSDSFNFKGFGASANKSLLSKWGMGCGCRIPISANFGFFEARPYLPLITAVVGFYYPLRFAVFVNASLPVELLRTGLWQCLDYMVWMMSMIYYIIWKFLITDFITKGVLMNSVKVMSKLLALEQSAMKDGTQERYGSGESNHGEESKVTQSEEGSKRNIIGENDRGSESANSDRSSLLILGRDFPALPKRRSVLYNPGISDRVGMNIGVHVSKRRGVEIRWHWWHVYNPTIDYMQTKYSELKDSLIKTSQSSKAISTLPIWLTEKFASLGVTWGGFNPEPPYYSGSALFSLSGLYPIEAIRKMRENRIERVARQTVEKQLGAKLKRKKEARMKEEEYEEIRQVKRALNRSRLEAGGVLSFNIKEARNRARFLQRQSSSIMAKRNQESDNEHEDQSPNKRHRIEDEEDGDDLTKKKINKPGKAAECGIIKKIYVEEFMCHKKLSINLCDNVNFVHGANGSGKSAILAALQICLGAKANRTHRARNLKDLVRKEDGATQARVRVTLLNCGPDAFQHKIYGDEITIERLISLAGSGGGYKLLDRNLKCKSTKKQDLTDLLDQLNIQVDNPVAILDQEEAKKFLTGKAEDKYNFFMKATDLERIDVKYSETSDSVQELEESIVAMQKKLQPLQSQVDLFKREWEAFEALEKLESKEAELTLKYAWSFYSQCLESYDGQKSEVDSIQNQVNALRKKLIAEEAKVVDDEEKDELEKKLGELTAEAHEATNAKQEFVRERQTLLAPKKKHEQEIKRKQQEVRNSKRKVDLAKRELQNKRDEIMRIQGSANDEEAQRQARMKKAEEDMELAKRTVEEATVEVNHSLAKYDEGKTRESALEQQVNSCKAQCSAVNSKIRDLQASQGNSLAVFGNKCESMSAAIEHARRAGKFKGKVVGPIGKYMKIVSGKEHLAGLAEHALGLGLDRFIVTNSHDRDVVLQIRDQVRCRARECSLSQMTDGPRYNVRLPPEGIDVVASVLTATDDLVFNCLVDNGRMDQKALFETMDESTRALQSVDANGKYHMKVQNIKTVFWLPRGDNWQLHNFMPTITSSNKPVKSPTVGIDKTRAIKEAQNDLTQLQREAEQKSSELHALKKERYQYKVQWNDWKKKSASAKKKINDLTNLIEQIKEEAENAENQTFDTSDLEDDVQLAQDEYDKLRSEEDELKAKLETFQPGIDEVTARIEENEARNKKIVKDMEDTTKQLEKCLQSEEKQKRNIAKRKKKVEEGEMILEKQKDELAEKEKSMNDTLHKAKMLTVRHHRVVRNKKVRAEHKKNGGEYEMDLVDEEGCTEEELEECEPMIMNKAPEIYAEKIRQTKKKIERERLNRNISESSPEVAFEKYMRAKKNFESKVDHLQKIEVHVDVLIQDLRDRKRKWKTFRDHIVKNSNGTFDEVLQRKGSSGKIEYDHKAQTLDICVRKDINDTTETRDVKALSGGERSFTTLALLIALGENLETPFRVMDEFDVFLDPVARKIALKTMIEVATSFENRQFIFITPQDLSNIKTTPKLRMFHLEPPKRNARVGGPVQTTLG